MNDQTTRNGPEFAPLKEYVKSFKVKVKIFDKDDELIREETLDYGKQEDKVWLGKLSYWSWTNGHYVETSKAE